jgi:hypothetical protein
VKREYALVIRAECVSVDRDRALRHAELRRAETGAKRSKLRCDQFSDANVNRHAAASVGLPQAL